MLPPGNKTARLQLDAIPSRNLFCYRNLTGVYLLTGGHNPTRYQYHLTEKGADLLPVLQALAVWGTKHIPERWAPPARFMTATPSDYYPT